MIAEEVEFQISQYVDGTLTLPERQAIDALLQTDANARKLLVDYRRLDSQLVELTAGPSIQWDRLAGRISNRTAEDSQAGSSVLGRIGHWSARLRVAAALLVAGTAWMSVRHFTRGHSPAAPLPTAITIVNGPSPEVPTGPAVTDISVGPSALAVRSGASNFAQGASVGSSPRVVLSKVTPPLKPDSQLH